MGFHLQYKQLSSQQEPGLAIKWITFHPIPTYPNFTWLTCWRSPRKFGNFTQLFLSCYLHVAIIYVPVAWLEEFQYWKASMYTGVSFSCNLFMGTALTLKTCTSSIPCGSGVSKITVIVTTELFMEGKSFASTCFIWLEAPSPLLMVMLYHCVGNESQLCDTLGQEVGEVACTHGNTDHVSPLSTFNCMCT